MSLAKKIKEARIEKGFTQKQLAEQILKNGQKASNTTIANWESGLNSPDIDTLQVMCTILEKDGNYFFNIVDEPKKSINKYDTSSLELLENYNKLNEMGKRRANEYIKDLTKIIDYTDKNK